MPMLVIICNGFYNVWLARMCHQDNKNYYQGREFTFTGLFIGIQVPRELAKLISQSLGSTFKTIPTRGCRNIKKALPKEKNTLGQVNKEENTLFWYLKCPQKHCTLWNSRFTLAMLIWDQTLPSPLPTLRGSLTTSF